jgi:DNA-binding GntR family transcriptional regulator
VEPLPDLADRLYDRGTRYRHLMLKVDLSNRRLVDEHQQLVSAVIERDAIKGAELLRAHMALTANIS